MTFFMVFKCSEGVMFKIWLTSDEFEGIKNPLKIDDISRILAGVDDELMILTGAGVLDDIMNGLHMP